MQSRMTYATYAAYNKGASIYYVRRQARYVSLISKNIVIDFVCHYNLNTVSLKKSIGRRCLGRLAPGERSHEG